MAKVTKKEFLDNIQGIINEGMNQSVHVDHTRKFEIGRYVAGLFESGQRNPKLMTYLNNYNNLLNSGSVKEFMLFEQFGQGLSQYASGNIEVKNVIKQMNETIKTFGNELEAYKLIECIQDPDAQNSVRCAYDNYLEEEDDNACNILIDAIDMCQQAGDPVAPKLIVVITDDYQNRLPQIDINTTESKFDEIQRKIKEEKQRKQLEDVKAQVDAYARKVFDEAEAEKQAEKDACNFESIVNNNGICLKESIKNIVSSDAKSNKMLMETMEQYAGALNQGLFEERLYESFLNNISKFNYLLPVEKEIKRINEVANKNIESITVTKILEEMSTSTSYYIIPLIEEDAVRYVKNPSPINRSQLQVALCSFANDPYCHAMLGAIENDNRMAANTLSEKALSIKDQIKMIHENAHISTIYSPVQYVKENECIFNANGQFYVKKGNTLAKISDEYLNQLSENFVSLCQLVNDPHVTINKDSITLVGNEKIARIYEGYAEINGIKETQDTLRNLNEMCMKYDYDTNFFIMTSCLLENFNNIANINFGKHVALNADEGVNVDMFRLGNNIFVNTVNENTLKSTFYHNVNPIQCRTLINKHMGINVASLFEDLLPSQDKLLMKLNETKNEYEASIEKYEATIEKLKKAKEECVSEDNEEKLDTAIESAKKKVEELKKEYKDWQEKAEKTIDADKDDDKTSEKTTKKSKKDDKEDNEEDPNTDVEKNNEPIDADEVDNVKSELTTPIGETPEDIEEDPTISDEEFDDYLNDETPDDEGDTIDTENLPEDEPEIEDNNSEEDIIEPEESEDEPIEDAFDEVSLDDIIEEPDEDISIENDDIKEPEEIEPEENFSLNDIEEPDEDISLNDIDEELIESQEITVAMPEGYKIANIAFDQNIKTGEIFKTGNITVVCPMVDGSGRMYVKSCDYEFYIDEETHLPVVNASDIPVALYNAIVASIQQDAQFIKADSEGQPIDDSEDDKDSYKNIFYDADEIDKASKDLEKYDDDLFIDFGDEADNDNIETSKDEDDSKFEFSEDPEGKSFTISAKEDEEDEEDDDENDDILKNLLGDDEDEADDIVIPTYKDGDTEIELPAADVDDSDIPEISSKEAKSIKDEDDIDDLFATNESFKRKRNKHLSVNEARKAFVKLRAEYKGGKSFFLNEGTIKPSKKEVAHINGNLGGVDFNNEALIYEGTPVAQQATGAQPQTNNASNAKNGQVNASNTQFI